MVKLLCFSVNKIEISKYTEDFIHPMKRTMIKFELETTLCQNWLLYHKQCKATLTSLYVYYEKYQEKSRAEVDKIITSCVEKYTQDSEKNEDKIHSYLKELTSPKLPRCIFGDLILVCQSYIRKFHDLQYLGPLSYSRNDWPGTYWLKMETSELTPMSELQSQLEAHREDIKTIESEIQKCEKRVTELKDKTSNEEKAEREKQQGDLIKLKRKWNVLTVKIGTERGELWKRKNDITK